MISRPLLTGPFCSWLSRWDIRGGALPVSPPSHGVHAGSVCARVRLSILFLGGAQSHRGLQSGSEMSWPEGVVGFSHCLHGGFEQGYRRARRRAPLSSSSSRALAVPASATTPLPLQPPRPRGPDSGAHAAVVSSAGEIAKGSAVRSSLVTLAFQEPGKKRGHQRSLKQQEGWACPPFVQLPLC